jgi:hypothetical protein
MVHVNSFLLEKREFLRMKKGKVEEKEEKFEVTLCSGDTTSGTMAINGRKV